MTISTWIHRNILGSSADFASINPGPDPEEQDIEKGLDGIKDQVDTLRQPVNVSLQGGYNTLSRNDKLILGASGGALVGGALGAAKGFLGASAPFTVDPHWNTQAINTQTLAFDQSRVQVAGTTQVATSNGLQDVNVPNAAIRYHFEPRVETKQVGEFKTPGQVDTHHPFTTNSLMGAAQGAAVGALGGVAITAGFILVQHLRGQDGTPAPTQNVSFGDEKKTIAKTAALGAALGAGVGALDGLLEHARAGATQTIEWDTPIYQHQSLGTIPKDASIIVRSDVRYDQGAFNNSQVYNDPSKFSLDDYLKHGPKVDVQGDVPEKHILGIGGYKMEHHTQTYTSEARYGVGTTVVGGLVLGGLVGVAAGVAINVIRKIVNS